MGEHERDWDGAPEGEEDPPSEPNEKKSSGATSDQPAEDYLRPHLPSDMFGSQIGPAAAEIPEAAPAQPEAQEDDERSDEALAVPPLADEEEADVAEMPPPSDTMPDRPLPVPPAVRTQDLPKPDAATRREIESAIEELQLSAVVAETEPSVVPRPIPIDPGYRPRSLGRPAPLPNLPSPPEIGAPTWVEWRSEVVDPLDRGETTRVEAAPSHPGAAQPRATDYLVLHPFPLRALICALNFALVMLSPWLAGLLLEETVYYPALDVVAEVWFFEFGIAPTVSAVLLALWITVRRRRHWRYEFVYVLVAWLGAGAAVVAAVLSIYEAPELRGTYLLVIWGGLLSLLPLLTSLHVNMDPSWVVGRRRYWTGAAAAATPTLLTIGIACAGVAAVHDAHGQWRQFMAPTDEEFCQTLFDPQGARPGPLAMAVLGRRRDASLAGRVAGCAQTAIAEAWSDNKARRNQPVSKAAVPATGDALSVPWRDNQKNAQLSKAWRGRIDRLVALAAYVSTLPAPAQATYRQRIRSKGPTRVECENPFRASDAALWRAAGHPDCGHSLDRTSRIKRAMVWLHFLGSRAAFSDPMMNDLRGDEAKDFRTLLRGSEPHAIRQDGETRTNDVTLDCADRRRPARPDDDRSGVANRGRRYGSSCMLISYPGKLDGARSLFRIVSETNGARAHDSSCKLRNGSTVRPADSIEFTP